MSGNTQHDRLTGVERDSADTKIRVETTNRVPACVMYLGEFDRPFSGKADLVDLLLAFLEEEPARFHIVDPNDQLENKNFSQIYYCEMPAGETTHDIV